MDLERNPSPDLSAGAQTILKTFWRNNYWHTCQQLRPVSSSESHILRERLNMVFNTFLLGEIDLIACSSWEQKLRMNSHE
jgi:hypothetical protein